MRPHKADSRVPVRVHARGAAAARWCLTALLMCVALVATAAPEPVSAVLDAHEQHGYPSPLLALRRLQTATGAPGAAAPVEDQARYLSELGGLVALAGEASDLDAVVARLERLVAQGGCASCPSRLLVVRTARSRLQGDAAALRALVDELASLPPAHDPRLQVRRLGAQARALQQLGDPEAALAAAVRAVELANRHGWPAVEAAELAVVVHAHVNRADLKQAQEAALRGYAIAQRIGHRYMAASFLINLNYVYGVLKQREKERAAIVEALSLTDGQPGTERLERMAYSNLAAYHIHRGEYPQAIGYTHRAEALARTLGDQVGVAFAISNRGSSMARMGEVEAGIALMESAIRMTDRMGDRTVSVDLLNELVNVYEAVGQPLKALAALRRVVALSGEITTAEREKAVLELQEQFAAERRTREIERLSLSNARAQAEVAARAWQQRMWASLAVALMLAAVLLVLWLRTVRRRNQALKVDNDALASQSIHDTLTGAFNRRHFEQLMSQHEVAFNGRSHARDYKATVGLVLLDVDFFKKVNDTHGHAAGDAVLVAVAQRLGDAVREQDSVVRWGGEEFVVVLPGTAAESLPVVAAKLLGALGRDPIVHHDVEIPVRVSAGAIAWPAWPSQSWSDALHVADLALYLSKSGGRNRATCLKRIAPGAEMARVHSDLGAAVAAGDVEIVTVPGPSREIGSEVAAADAAGPTAAR